MAIEFFAGDDKTLQFTINQAGTTTPLDLTNVTVAFRMVKPGNVVINKTEGSGITIIDAEAGRCNVQINSADTADITTTTSIEYELQLTIAGKYDTVQFSTMSIKRNLIYGAN